MQTSTQTQPSPSLWSRLRSLVRREGPSIADSEPEAVAPRWLGSVVRLQDGSLQITQLLSTDVLFEIGCQAGDVILALDGAASQRIPDDLLYGAAGGAVTRAIINRRGTLYGMPSSEYGDSPDPTRVSELMRFAMQMLNADPEQFALHNRLEATPSARPETTQPDTQASHA